MTTSAPPQTKTAVKKSHTKLILWLVVAVALVALALYARHKINFDWHVFSRQLRQANWIKFAIAIGLIYAAYVLRAARWAVFLKPVKRVSPLSLLGSQVIGFTGVALFGRLADLIRPYLIARRVNLPIGSQIAVYTVERMFDLGSMALIFSTVLLLSPERATLPHHELLGRAAFAGLLASFALAVFAGIVRFSGNAIALVAERGLGSVSPKVGASVGSKIRAFRDGLNTLSSFGDFALAFGISLLMWGLITTAYLQTVHAFTASPELGGMTFARCLVLMAASLGASIVQLPIIGWFTSIGIMAGTMHTIFGVANEPALAAAAMLLVVTFMSIIPVGLIWAKFEHVSLKKVAAESEEAAEHPSPPEAPLDAPDLSGVGEPTTRPDLSLYSFAAKLKKRASIPLGVIMAAKTRDKSAEAEPVRKSSILKGALAGLVGGLAGSAVKIMAEAIIPPRLDGEAPPAVLAEKAVGHPLDPEQKIEATKSIHWIFGPLAGAAYGAIAEARPEAAAWRGIAFGLTLNRITHEGLLPKAGLAPPVEKQPMQQRVSEWVSHAAYGLTTDMVRRGVRAGLD